MIHEKIVKQSIKNYNNLKWKFLDHRYFKDNI